MNKNVSSSNPQDAFEQELEEALEETSDDILPARLDQPKDLYVLPLTVAPIFLAWLLPF